MKCDASETPPARSCKTLAASSTNCAAANFFIKVKVLFAAACPFYLFRVRQVIFKKSLKFFNENLLFSELLCENLPLTGVWQNGGILLKRILRNFNYICASSTYVATKTATSPSAKTLVAKKLTRQQWQSLSFFSFNFFKFFLSILFNFDLKEAQCKCQLFWVCSSFCR